ncbi:hypothetical protein HKD37_03G006497 [Glycine soja]
MRNFYKRSSSSPTLPQPHYTGKSPNHSDAQQHMAMHTHTIVPIDGDHNDAHPGCLMKSILFCTTMLNSYKMQMRHWSMSMVNSMSGKKLKKIWLMFGHPKNCAKLTATM